MLLDLVDDFISDQLKYSLDQVCSTVAYVCNRLKTGSHESLVNDLNRWKIRQSVINVIDTDSSVLDDILAVTYFLRDHFHVFAILDQIKDRARPRTI